MLVLTCAYFLCYEELSYTASVFGFPMVTIGYGLLVIGAISPGSFLYHYKSRSASFIATLSYSIYLTHKGIIHITQELAASESIAITSNVMLLLCTVTCILGSFLLHLTVEKPFMKWREKWIHE